MEDTRKVKIRKVSGYRDGEEVDLPLNRALTYCENGQADPVDWDPNTPVNRMMDTSGSGRNAPSRRSPRKKASKRTRKSPADSGE